MSISKLKRALSTLMAVMLLVGILPLNTLATATNFADQVVNAGNDSVYFKLTDGENAPSGDPSNYAVKLGKTIRQTAENEFDITLSVQTRGEETINTSLDSAVVLVLDVSGSMKDCAICGKSKDYHNMNHNYQSRMNAAKNSANAFLTQYVQNAGTAKRWVSIVIFGEDGNTVLQWTDANASKNNTVNTAVTNGLNSVDARNEGTNLEAGLMLARNLMTNGLANNGTIRGTSNTNVILLTDGVPTYHVTGNSQSTTKIDGERGGGNYAAQSDYRDIPSIAKDIMDTNSKKTSLFALTYAVSDKVNEKTIENWLKTDVKIPAENISSASTPTGLSAALASINQSITNSTVGAVVTDPMGAGIQVMNFVPGQGASLNGNTITWDLGQATATTDASGAKSFSYTYHVKFDSSMATPDGVYATNGAAKLEYSYNSGTTSTEKTAYFPVPTVKGYCANLTVKKVSVDNVPLANAQFTATRDGFTQVFTSNKDGDVAFRLPSGHTYTITETSAPTGFVASDKSATVTVKYGVAIVTGDLFEGNATNGYKVTNARDPKNINVTVSKKWIGGPGAGNGQTVTVKVYPYTLQNGKEVLGELADTLTITGTGEAISKALPSIDVATGNSISYTVREEASDSYEQVNTSRGENNRFTIVNLQNGKQNITISKTWVGPAQDSVKLQLYRDGVAYGDPHQLTAGAWSKTIENVPTFKSNANLEQSVYTVSELGADGKPVEGNSVTLGGVDYTVSTDGTAVTNTVVQQNDQAVQGSKVWNVAALSDEEKNALAASITLYADGKPTDMTDAVTFTDTTYSFNALPKYAIPGTVIGTQNLQDLIGVANMNGHEIQYTVGETHTGADTIKSAQSENLFTNTLTGTVDVSVAKIWEDEDNKYNSRPDSVTLLLMNGNTEVARHTFSAVAQTAMQDVQIGTDEEGKPIEEGSPIMEPQEVTTVEKTWDGVALTHTFTGLAKYDASGALIHYSVSEDGLDEGKIEGTGNYKYSMTTTKNAETGLLSVTNTLNGEERSIEIAKKWLDTASDDTRTAQATINLTVDGTVIGSLVTSKNESKTFTFWYNGGNINVSEDTVEGYEVAVIAPNEDGTSYMVTNKIKQDDTIEIQGSKAWVGGSELARPDVSFVLYQNGIATNKTHALPAGAATASPEAPYEFSFPGLEKYNFANGTCTLNSYYIVEEMTGDLQKIYTKTDSDEDGVRKFVNTFTPGSKSVAGEKVWVAGNYRPEAMVGLFVGDTKIDEKKTVELQYGFEVPIYNELGEEIAYTVRELDEQGNAIAENGTYQADGKDFIVTYKGNTIFNTLPQSQDVTIPVTKIWQGPAGDEVTFTLSRSANGTNDTGFVKTLTLTAENAVEGNTSQWQGTFENLDKINTSGHEYSYTVTETEVKSAAGHEYELVQPKTQEQNVFVNRIKQVKRDFSVLVAWKGTEADAKHPEVTVQLLANGALYGEPVRLNEANSFANTFKDLDTYAGDTYQPIVYTVKEVGEEQGVISLRNNTERYDVTYAYKSETENLSGFDALITNTIKNVDSYSYKITRYYTQTVNGVAQPTVIESDASWTTAQLGDKFAVNTATWNTQGGRIYNLASANVNNVAQTGASFEVEIAKLADGANTYEIHIYYSLSRTTGGGGGGGPITPPGGGTIGGGNTDIEDVDPPLAEIPDVDPPLTEFPDEEVIEEPEVPLGEAPKTGDESRLGLWAVLMGLSGVSIAALLGSKKRKEDA